MSNIARKLNRNKQQTITKAIKPGELNSILLFSVNSQAVPFKAGDQYGLNPITGEFLHHTKSKYLIEDKNKREEFLIKNWQNCFPTIEI